MSVHTFEDAKAEGRIKMPEKPSYIFDDPRIDAGSKKYKKLDRETGKVIEIEQKVQMPPHQVFETGAKVDLVSFPMNPAFPTDFFVSDAKLDYTYTLPAGKAQRLRKWQQRLVVSESGGSNSVTINPPFYGFSKIDWQQDNKSIQTEYPDSYLAKLALCYSPEQLAQILPNVLVGSGFLPSVSGDSSCVIAANASKQILMPFPASWIENCKPVLSTLKKDLDIVYSPRPLVSAGSGTLRLSQPILSLEHKDLAEKDSMDTKKYTFSNILKTYYLDCIKISKAYTLTAATKTSISLNTVKGKVAFAIIKIRSSLTPLNQGYSANVSLGKRISSTPAIQFIDTQDKDIFCHGTALTLNDLALMAARHAKTPEFFDLTNTYLIAFGDVQRALAGDMKAGYVWFDGKENSLKITPDDSPAFTTGSYLVDADFYYFRSASQEKGELVIEDA